MKIRREKFSFFTRGVANLIPFATIENVSDLTRLIKNARDLRALARENYELYKEEKIKLDYITPTGVYSARENAGIESLSCLFTIDIDEQHFPPGMTLESAFEALKTSEYIRYMAYSPSGKGIWILVPYDFQLIKNAIYGKKGIEDVELRLKQIVEAFGRLYLERKYKIQFDGCSKVLSQPRLIGYSPEIYDNPAAEAWSVALDDLPWAGSEKPPVDKKRIVTNTGDKKRDYLILDELADIAMEAGVDIFGNEFGTGYHDWQRSALAIAHVYGEEGRPLFEKLSRLRPRDTQAADPKKVKEKYDEALKVSKGNVTLSTLFWLFKNALGKKTFTKTVEKYKDASPLARSQELQEYVEFVEKILAEMKWDLLKDSDPQAITVIAEVIKFLREREFVYCFEENHMYVKEEAGYTRAAIGEDGGRYLIETAIKTILKKYKMPISKSNVEYIKGYVDLIVKSELSKPFCEIIQENTNYKPDGVNTFRPDPVYTIDRFLECLSVDYDGYLYTKEDIRLLWAEFFAGIGNILFRPLNKNNWTGSHRVPVLAGKIGIGKTYFIEHFVEDLVDRIFPASGDKMTNFKTNFTSFDMPERDLMVALRDNFIILLDDIEERALNSAKTRQYLTSAGGSMRGLFTTKSETFIRKAHFIATTNHKRIIRQVQHNRRFFPIVLKAHADSPYAFKITPDFNALELIIDAMRIVKEEFNGNYQKLKKRVDIITEATSKIFSADGDVVTQIKAEYLKIDLDALTELARSTKPEHKIYNDVFEQLRFTKIQDLRKVLQLDKNTINAALQTLEIDMIETVRRVKGRKSFYGYPIINRDTEFILSDGRVVKASNLPKIFVDFLETDSEETDIYKEDSNKNLF